MRGRWILLFALLAAAVPIGVWAATSGRFDGNVDRQRAKFRTNSIATSSRFWRDIPVLAASLCAANEVSATLSINLSGARARFRVTTGRGSVYRPGAAEFAPNGLESFSYTFVRDVGALGGADRHSLKVQWRSPSGNVVRMTRGSLNVLYELGICS